MKGEAGTLNNIGGAYFRLEDYNQALKWYEQALEIQQDIGVKPDEAVSLGNLGITYSRLGNHARALDFYQR